MNADRREQQKKRLRANVIDRNAQVEVRKSGGGRAAFLILLVTAGLIAVFFCYRYFARKADSFSMVWEKELGQSSEAAVFRGYAGFEDGVILYTRDGAEYIDRNGRSVWQKSYQMDNPVAAVQGSWAVIADQGGTSAAVFSAEQNTGTISTSLPISRVAISGKGVVYAVLNDDSADFITAYRKDGSAIDLTVKSVISGDGYPFDIAVSPDGSQLLTAYLSLENGSVKSSAVFRNFGEVGQNEDAERVVGGFIDEFEGHILTKVSFADESHSHAFYDGGVVFFSTKVLNSPEVILNLKSEQEIRAVADCPEYTALIRDAEGDAGGSELLILDNEGKEKGKAALGMVFTGLTVSGTNVIVYSADRILAFRPDGTPVADLSYDGRIVSVTGTEKLREFIVAENARLCLIRAE